MNRTLFSLSLLATAALITGCATQSQSPSVYNSGQTQREQSVRFATIEAVRPVTIAQQQSGVGTGAGAAIGGVLGSLAGQNSRNGVGSLIGSVVGAVGGGIAGQSIENAKSQKLGFELTYRYENGQISSLVQDADVSFKVGDKVRVLSGGGVTRVAPL